MADTREEERAAAQGVVRLCHPLPWKEQIAAAKAWLFMKWIRGHGEGEENAQLLRQVREHADRMESFSFYHVLGLEMFALLLESKSAKAFARLNGPALLAHFLSRADVPDEIREHYAAKGEECHRSPEFPH
jgi:hypothetical protein